MIKNASNILTNLFLYLILPLSIIVIIIVLAIIIARKNLSLTKKNKLLLKTLASVFTIFAIYTLTWSIIELIPLKQYNVFAASRVTIILWIILPICPSLASFILWNKYKTLKKAGEKND